MKYGIWPIADEVNYELQKLKEWFHKVFSYYHTVTIFQILAGSAENDVMETEY